MRYFYLVLGAAIVSGCSQNIGSLPLSASSQSQVTHASGVTPYITGGVKPHITKLSRIEPKQYQKVVISGTGFGTMKPYDGDSAYIRIRDKTGAWDAGHTSSSEIDSVWLDVTQWSDRKIVITGFTNDYGESGWVLKKGDHIEVYVWNPQDRDGPATKAEQVK